MTVRPDDQGAQGPDDIGPALAELRQKLPGMADVAEPQGPRMHRTDTVDLGIVVSGRARLELDDGVQIELEAGDCVVQNGTRHGCHNPSREPCVLAFALVGASRS